MNLIRRSTQTSSCLVCREPGQTSLGDSGSQHGGMSSVEPKQEPDSPEMNGQTKLDAEDSPPPPNHLSGNRGGMFSDMPKPSSGQQQAPPPSAGHGLHHHPNQGSSLPPPMLLHQTPSLQHPPNQGGHHSPSIGHPGHLGMSGMTSSGVQDMGGLLSDYQAL